MMKTEFIWYANATRIINACPVVRVCVYLSVAVSWVARRKKLRSDSRMSEKKIDN